MVDKLLGVMGLGLEKVYINFVELTNVYFFSNNYTSEITEEAIDGEDGMDVSTHIKNKNVELSINFTLSTLLFGQKDLYEELVWYRDTKKIIQLTGTDFDNLDFAIQSIVKTGEGINFIDGTIVLKELKFVVALEFEYDDTVKGRAEYKKSKKKSKSKTKDKPMAYSEESYQI